MSAHDFKMPPPTVKQTAGAVAELHQEVVQLAQHMGARMRDLEQAVKDNNAITDQAMADINSKIEFLMTLIRVPLARHGALAGPDGKIPVEIKTAQELYHEAQSIIQERKRAQGLSTAEVPARGPSDKEGRVNGETHDDLDADAYDDCLDPDETKH